MRGYKEFWEKENIRIALAIEDLKEEWGAEGICLRLIYLYERMEELKALIAEYASKYTLSIQIDKPYLERHGLAVQLKRMQKDYSSLSMEFDRIIGVKTKGQITDEMIQRAREYPIEHLIEVDKKGFALCVNHADKKPSMLTRGNYAHCFSCGYTGDVLDVAMKVKGWNFVEAVKALNT